MATLTIVGAHLRHQLGRSLATGAGVLCAVVAFVILTGSVQTAQLATTATVNANFRSSYDILVRPHGSQTALETSSGLVRPNYLSGIYGGISPEQLKQIKSLAGVQVAAPIAMLGQIFETVQIPVDITDSVTPATHQLFKFNSVQQSMRGLARAPGSSGYTYISSDTLQRQQLVQPGVPTGDTETRLDNSTSLVCPGELSLPGAGPDPGGPFSAARLWSPSCWSTDAGLDGQGWSSLGKHHYAALVQWSFPILLAAIDPAAEAQLAGLDKTIDSGRYLRPGDQPSVTGTGFGKALHLPVLAASRTVVDEQSLVTVQRLQAAAAAAVSKGLSEQATAKLVTGATGPVVQSATVTAQQAYSAFLSSLSADPGRQQIDNYWTAGPVSYSISADGHLHPATVSNPDSVWQSQYRSGGYVDVPSDASNTSFRKLASHVGDASGTASTGLRLPGLDLVGTYDVRKLPGFSELSALPLETYQVPAVAAGDARTRDLLKNQQLAPDLNSAGYLQQPPLLLTTLDAISSLTDSAVFANTDATTPISVVRVRVNGVTGSDPVSRERVRLVASRIQQLTGLDVDITIGSSPTLKLVDLPATAHGSPALVVSEKWVEKGVAVRLLHAIDRKSLLLFILVLLVCALVVSNATSAAVRARRTELAILSCLGWQPGRLYRTVLFEVAAIGLAAGITGAVIAVPVGALLGNHVSIGRAALAIPAAVLLAGLAGLVPAWRASRVDPIAAVHEPVLQPRAGLRIRGVTSLAVVSLLRTPGRLLLGMSALSLGVAALTLLLGVKAAFHGSVVGSLLGNAVDVEVRGADLVAAIVMILLGLAAIADILYLDIREQAARYAALQAAGWSDAAVGRLVVTQAALIAAAGSVLGGVVGVLLTNTVAAQHLSNWLVALIVGLGAVLATMLVSLIPAAALRRLPTARLLSMEV
jgi:putative ABC transport system permease protein